MFLTHDQLKVTSQAICLPRLPEALHGLQVVQISDLHFYEYSDARYYQKVSEQVQQLRPAVLVLTGDVVHHGNAHLDKAKAFLSSLPPDAIKLAVLGNHDYDDGGRGRHVEALLQETGFQLLKNDVCELDLPQGKLCFLGIDDLWYGEPRVKETLARLPEHANPVIALAHNPLLFDPIAYNAQGAVDLVLSGHTHSGHVYIPFLGPIYKKIFRMKYRYGLFEKHGCQLYVTSGVGSAAFYMKKRKLGFPRFRYNTWPEIAVHTLLKA